MIKKSTLEKYQRVVDEWLVNGRNGTKAYQSVYTTSSEENAAIAFIKILSISKIKNYLSEREEVIRKKVKERHEVTLETQIKSQINKVELYEKLVELALKDELTTTEEDVFKRMKEVVNLAGVNKAEDMINRMLGLYEADNNSTLTIEESKLGSLPQASQMKILEEIRKGTAASDS